MCDRNIGATQLSRIIQPNGTPGQVEAYRRRIARYMNGNSVFIGLHNINHIAAALNIPDKDLVYATYEELRDSHGQQQHNGSIA